MIVEILYSDFTVKRVDVTDAATLADDALVPKTGVLGAGLYDDTVTPEEVVEYIDGADNYQLAIKPIESRVSLYGWADSDGGWWHITNPRAADGYGSSPIMPFLLPYKPRDVDYYIFRGEQIDNEVWADTADTRLEMGQRR